MRNLSALLASEGVVEGAWEAYQSIVPFAFRADMWRAAMIWANGGIYLDDKMRLQYPWTTWADTDKGRLSICYDGLLPGMYNAFLAAKPRSPALASILQRAVRLVNIRSMGEKPEGFKGNPYFRKMLGVTSTTNYYLATQDMPEHIYVPCLVRFLSLGYVKQRGFVWLLLLWR